MVLREIVRVPLGMWDEYRALCFKQPRAMNFWMMNAFLITILFLGKGVEKLSITSNHASAYEASRRAHRFYIPYFFADYRWRFPVNK